MFSCAELLMFSCAFIWNVSTDLIAVTGEATALHSAGVVVAGRVKLNHRQG